MVDVVAHTADAATEDSDGERTMRLENAESLITTRNWPQISVIIPFYGQDADGVARCVDSLSNQDYPKNLIRIILVDNNPTAILAKHPALSRPDVTTLHEPKPGSYSARNHGIRHATGEVFAFTDADCIPDPSWLTEGVSALMDRENCGLAAGAIKPIFANSNKPNWCELFDKCVHLRQEEYVRDHHFGATANVITYATVFDRVGLFDDTFFSGGDREWGIRVWKSGLELIFAEGAVVHHDARNRMEDLFSKARRLVGQGYVYARNGRGPLWWRLLKIELRLAPVWVRLIWRNRITLAPSDFGGVLTVLCGVQAVRFAEAIRLGIAGKAHR